MPMWIRLKVPKTLEVSGVTRHYKPGDWVEIGRSTANTWIQQGIAERVDYDVNKEYVDLTAGIVLIGSINQNLLDNLKQDIKGIEIANSDVPEMYYSENMLWINGIDIKREMVGIGFNLLKKWQVAIPIYDYDKLAVHIKSTKKEKEYIESVIHDLRVPVYNTNLIFIRRCSETKELLEQWEKEKELIKDDKLSFQVAYYKTKPTLSALPVNWCANN